MARLPKNLEVRLTLRMTSEEDHMVSDVQTQYPGISANDAIRMCIRRGYALVRPTADRLRIDAPVLHPDDRPPPAPTDVPDGQLTAFDPEIGTT